MPLKKFMRAQPRVFTSLGLVLGMLVGCTANQRLPEVDSQVMPVRVNFNYSNVHRNNPGDYAYPALCFTLSSDKVRAGTSPNIDVFTTVTLVDGKTVRAASMWFEPTSHRLWQSNNARPVSRNQNTDWCAPLPPEADSRLEVAMDATMYYPGWMNWWDAPTVLPVLVDNPLKN